MDLRSSTRSRRSKSKTPFSMTNTEQDYMEEKHSAVTYSENIRTTSTIVKTTNGNSSFQSISEEQSVNTASTKPTPSRRTRRTSKLYKTSDYSSEDEENEVSSTRSITENERNRILEDAKKSAENSTGITALGLYRRAKRYWEEYPKTDWTYSRYSKDRVEIAPGVVAMPNMSRRHISSYDKYTNTDSFSQSSHLSFLRTRSASDRNASSSVVKTIILRMLVAILRVVHLILKPISYVYRLIHTVCITLARGIYLGTSAIMLLDTWLLRSNRTYGKTAALTALCVVPFLLIGGLWLSLSSGGNNWGSMMSLFSLPKSTQESPTSPKIFTDDQFSATKIPELSNNVPYSLTENQLEEIAQYVKKSLESKDKINYDEITNHILKTEKIHNIINSYNTNTEFHDKQANIEETIDNQRKSIDELTNELNRLKLEITNLRNRQEDSNKVNMEINKGNTQKMDYFFYQLNRCCRKTVNLESHMFKTFVTALNNPEFLQNQKGLTDWLNTLFIAKNELEKRISALTESLNSNFTTLIKSNSKFLMDQVAATLSFEVNKKYSTGEIIQGESENKINISEHAVRRIVRDTLNIYDADKTGLVDYAMEPMGGQVITTRCTESYHAGTAVVSVFGLPLWYPVASPRTVITPGLNPGKCWAFQNFPGLLVIKLMIPIKIEAVSYEHVSKLLVPNGKIDSAPKDLEIYGLEHENDRNGVLIGSYRYDYNGESLQFFPTQSSDLVFQYVELRINSNHGNPNYTCLYRFRVHGKTVSS